MVTMFNKHKLAIFLFMVFIPSLSEAYETFEPWDFTNAVSQPYHSQPELSLPASLLKAGVVIFSKYISPIDGDRCSLYPTCAAYSREAVEKHGFLFGMLLTVDRLIHESNEMDTAPLVKVYDRLRYLDPVSNNDFWW